MIQENVSRVNFNIAKLWSTYRLNIYFITYIFMQENILESKTCAQCSENFNITQADRDFYEKVSPSFWGKKYLIPDPTLCPDCRQQRRLAWRNERKLYKRKCDATGKDIISIYSPDKKNKIYEKDFWWSDSWSAISYEKDINLERDFFELLGWHFLSVPVQSLLHKSSQDCEYTNDNERCHNCYYCSTLLESEDCMYSDNCFWSKSSMDTYWLLHSWECYECLQCAWCNSLKFASYCNDCSLSSYLQFCDGVQNSVFCIGLINKKNYFLNQEKSEWEIWKILEDMKDPEKFSKYLSQYKKLCEVFPRRMNTLLLCEDSTWDYLVSCKRVHASYSSHGCLGSKYLYWVWNMENSYDCNITWSEEIYGWNYDSISIPWCSKIFFSASIWDSHDVLYSNYCYNSSFIFGCVWLRNKQYCILNKQYTKEEYEILVPKIIEHMKTTWEWGEFFPANISPFGYNETVAQEYFPLSKTEAESKNFNWSDYEAPLPKVDKIIPASKLPEDIVDIPDDILNWAIECEVSKKPFRIIRQELDFYRKHNLPIPKRHPDQRHLDRMKLRNPRKLFTRNCDKCDADIQTTYAPERPETVYCEKCYNAEIY